MELIKKYWIVIVIAFGLAMFIKPAACFLILGLLVFYVGISAVKFLRNIKKVGIECTGSILEYQADSDGYKTPVVEFTTLAGEYVKEKPFVYASTDLSKIRNYRSMRDENIAVLYDPADPKKFVLVQEQGFNYLTFIVFVIIGTAFVGLSICGLLGYIKFG